jgi:Domain of unknown function (DUF4185)
MSDTLGAITHTLFPLPIRRHERVRLIVLLLLGTASLGLAACDSCNNTPALKKVYTEHLGRLTSTPLNSIREIGITGTDLASSFVEPTAGRLVFLFGDSWTTDPGRFNQDSIAWTQSFLRPTRDSMPKLVWFLNDDSATFLAVQTNPPVDLGGMNVPVEGVSIGSRIYIFASTGWSDSTKRHCCSVLAHTDTFGNLGSLSLDHNVPSEKFINISAVVEGETVWIFGSGAYRQSSVYLAKANSSQIGDRNSWQYYQGMQSGNPVFGPGEANASYVVYSTCIGELSVRKLEGLGYTMLDNCGPEGVAPRGIHLRAAAQPWGTWAPPIEIFDPWADNGYGYFMHQQTSWAGYDDGLAEPGAQANLGGTDCPGNGWREECWGGEYGPFIVAPWFEWTQDGVYTIYYTLSTWVPYQVHLMKTVVARPGATASPPPSRGGRLPPASLVNGDFGTGDLRGWQSSGDTFATFKGTDGRWRVTTYTLAKGDNATGQLWQDFTVDANTKALRFWVHGGEATIKLLRGGEVIRATRGRSGHEPRNSPETPVCWQLGENAGDQLRLMIDDQNTGPWGFVGTTGFQFLTQPCRKDP